MDPYAALLILASFFLGFFVGLIVSTRRHIKHLKEINQNLQRLKGALKP